mgnify:CR=1 FL=1
MLIDYQPHGVCSRRIQVDVEGGVIQDVAFTGGCNANLKGISSLVKGMKVEGATQRLSGICCGTKGTSCPDQLSLALRQALQA